MKKLIFLASSLLVAAFIGSGNTNAQESPAATAAVGGDVPGTGVSGVGKLNSGQVTENPKPIVPKQLKHDDPNAHKDYSIYDAVRDIPYVTDVGKNRSIIMQRRLREVKTLSDDLHSQVNFLLEMSRNAMEAKQEVNEDETDIAAALAMNLGAASITRSLKGVASQLRQYEEKLKELPDEIEWRDDFLEKIDKSRKIITYVFCKVDYYELDDMLLDLNSSPIDILDFMDRELVPYVKNYPNTVLYQNFQQTLKDYMELIADPKIKFKYPKVFSRPFLYRLKAIGNTYSVEFTRGDRGDVVSFEASLWEPGSSREAGTRQTLKIGKAEYGFVWIPAGEFDMGSPESEAGRSRDEVLHHVKLTKGFWMLETEVTQALYREINGENPSKFKGRDLPVENVSWDDALIFCEELTARLSGKLKASLPTEAQWEYSCRAGTKTAYWYGGAADSSKMNYEQNKGKTTPVKSYDPNAWGLYDVHGNVCEWCLDSYGAYPSETVTDPKGPSSASNRVARGGSWSNGARRCRSAYRDRLSADDRLNFLGFRFILSCD